MLLLSFLSLVYAAEIQTYEVASRQHLESARQEMQTVRHSLEICFQQVDEQLDVAQKESSSLLCLGREKINTMGLPAAAATEITQFLERSFDRFSNAFIQIKLDTQNRKQEIISTSVGSIEKSLEPNRDMETLLRFTEPALQALQRMETSLKEVLEQSDSAQHQNMNEQLRICRENVRAIREEVFQKLNEKKQSLEQFRNDKPTLFVSLATMKKDVEDAVQAILREIRTEVAGIGGKAVLNVLKK